MRIIFSELSKNEEMNKWFKSKLQTIHRNDWWFYDGEEMTHMEVIRSAVLWLNSKDISIEVYMRKDLTGFDSYVVKDGIKDKVESPLYGDLEESKALISGVYLAVKNLRLSL